MLLINYNLYMRKFLTLTLTVLLYSTFVFAQSMTCPIQKSRNNGNNTAACPTGTCGTAGVSKSCNVVSTTYDIPACCTYTSKTADIQFSFSNLTNPSAEPALKTVWANGAPLNFNYGPPMTFTSSSDHSTSYCVYGVNGSAALPTAGIITLEFVDPATNITYNMCSYDAGATGSVNPVPGPSITTSPQNKFACSGNVVTFSVTATPTSAGDGLKFQWRLNGAPISGASSTSAGAATATYSLTASTGGKYDCVVSETGTGASAGTASISNYATLTIVTGAPTVTASAAPNPICAGNTLTLTGSATNANSYSWAGPGSYTSTALSPTLTASVTNAGVYTLSATNGCGTNTSTTASVTVNAAPSATVTATPSVLCSSGTLSLTATITGASSYSWTGPNSFTSTLQNPTLTATTSSGGVYTVSAAVACGTFVGTTTIVTVNASPTSVTATASATTLCSNSNLTLTGSATGASTYLWAGPGGTSIGSATSLSTGVTGVATGNAGVYTLTAVSAVGACSTTATTASVTVNASPTSVTATASPNGVCNGSDLTLTGAATGASTYSWAGPGGTAISSPTSQSTGVTGVVSGNAGVYTLTAVAATGSCSTTATTASVTVNALPSVSVGTSTVICTGSSTTLTASGGSTYSWSPSTGLSATTGSSVTASPTVTTTYTVTGTNTLSCTNTATVTVTVVNTTPTSVTANASSTSLCSGANLTLTSSATTSAGTLTYAWAGPNSYTASVQNPASFGVTTVSAGVYTVTATNVCGSTTGVTTAVTVNAVPTVAAISGSSSICTGTNTTYTNTTSGGVWSSSSPATGSINSSTGELTGISVGAFTVSYAVTNSCGTTTVTKAVSGFFTPTIGVSVGSASSCVASTTTYTATPTTGYTWSSTNTAVATINTGGSAVAVASGTTTISYVHNTAGCYTTAVLSVNALPTLSITTPVCAESTQTATGSPTGGAWASSNTAVGTIDAVTGGFSALSGGSTNISYTVSGCRTVTSVSVTGLPAAITGITSVCQGSTSQLSSGTASQTWSSSNTAVVTITTLNTTTAIVSGVSTGTSVISYTNGGGCSRFTTVTVAPPFTSNTGDALVCMGQTISLSNATSGGAWTSSDAAKATVNSSTGLVTAVATGTTNITYTTTSPSSCQSSTQVTVSAAVPANTGTASVCVGLTTTLSNATTGGTWSSGNANASVDANTGVVTGVTAGTSVLTYLLSSGCYKTTIVTVNPLPAVIGGTATLCEGESTTLTNSTSGGTWISSNTAVGTVGSLNGSVAAISAGTTIISYRLTATGCQSTKEVTVNALPSVISGTTLTCIGISTTLTATPAGGTWSSSTPAVATIGSADGSLTGITAGTSNITYTLATGCKRTTIATVNSNPAAIGGTVVLCEGASATLTNATSGGTWISSNTTVATIGSATGTVAALSNGTTTVSYKVSATGCYSTQDVTVNPLPAAITGSLSVCESSTTALSTTSTGGTWSSSNTAVATIGTNGLVSGLTAGTTNITYTLSTGCIKSATVTVNSTPATIGGSFTMCEAATTTLTNSTTGGEWVSGNTAVATIGSGTGTVSGVSGGTSTITYQIAATGCKATQILTVNPLPSAITGTQSVCEGSTTTLSSVTSGGTWSSSNTAIATVGTNGVVSGVAAGTANISYSLSSGCFRSVTATVNSIPATIGGTFVICESDNTTLTNATSGGVWSSSNTAVATVGSSTGTVTGVANGTATISYTVSGCYSTATLTVNQTPAAISGTATTCIGTGTTLNNSVSGGTWSSSNSAVATIGSATGTITVTGAGTSTISYIMGGGCYATRVYTVNALPTVSGTLSMCVATSSTLSSAPTGGTWQSSSTAVATVGSLTGVVTGVAYGNSTVTYTDLNGCRSTVQVTVNSAIATDITGPASVCVGYTITLANATSGGSWTSSDPTKATIDPSTGVVTGLTNGSVVITYALSAGCNKTKVLSIHNLPLPITGITTVCEENVTILSTVTGSSGTWSSSDPSVATVASTIGNVTGVASGIATITYTAAYSGCYVVRDVTVVPTPAPITGASAVCVGSQISLSNASTGGTWSSNSTSAAVVGSATGVVTGVGAGNTIISYILPNGCRAIKQVTVNITPAAISGNLSLCPAGTSTLTTTTTGGTWVSGDVSVATIGTGGAVTPVAPGTTTMSYTMGTGCMRTAVVTITPAPSAIAGPGNVCVGSTVLLSNATAGGTWMSSNTSKATIVFNTGLLSGVATGTSNITYTVPGQGCYTVSQVTIDATPAAITGTLNACVGFTSTLSHAITGGTWSSSNTAIATVDATTGVVTAVASGFATITYQTTSSCRVTAAFNSKALPATITGTPYACVGTSTLLSNTVSGGTWSSSNTASATIHTTSGALSGVAIGTSTITYKLATGCYRTTEVSVNAAPSAITGVAAVCPGSTTVLSCTPTGGAWTSGNTAIGTIDGTSGTVTGLASGTTSITYTQGVTGCRSTKTITVGVVPAAITGTLAICGGTTTSLASATTGGTWSSGNTAVATVGTSGVVVAVAPGTATINYNHTGGCAATAVVTVTPAVGSISGNPGLCVGGETTLTNAVGGGSWISSATAIATVGSATGIVSGVASGTVVVTYALSDYCYSTQIVTVSATPAAISGSSSVCIGSGISLTHAVSGGTWSSSTPSIGTVDATTGVVTGVAVGAMTITYEASNGCFTTKSINVSNLPPAISGVTAICESSSSALTCVIGGSGTWSSSDAAVATIGSTSGLLTGVTSGTAIITYMLGTTGCYSTIEATVNAIPAALTGSNTICVGSTETYTSTTSGGTWSSSNPTIASIDSATGVANGNTGGTVSVSYTIANGCRRVMPVTINVLPAAISGTTNYCAGGTATLTCTTTGGTWSSDMVAATVATGGVVTATTAGTSLISYTLGTGCARTTVVTVSAALAANTGSSNICIGSTTSLVNSTTGGVWSSSDATKASVGSVSGIVTGVAAGTADITYAVAGAGCNSITQVTVNSAITVITGTLNVCAGAQTTLSNTTTGGVWSSSDSAKATIDPTTGVVTGIAPGTVSITYSFSSACYRTATFTVKSVPSIGGLTSVCAGSSVTLTGSPAGGAWSSASTATANVNTTSGVVGGISAGTVTISYLSNGCYGTTTVTVNQLPDSISGSRGVCGGSTTTLVGYPSGGAWVSSVPARATIGSASGIVTGIAVGTSTISYTLATGCRRTTIVTVATTPNVITGTATVCAGSTTTLASTTAGGTWSSSNAGIATTGTAAAASTLVTGVSAGTVTISYTVLGCSRLSTVTVNAPVGAPSGDTSMCVGSITTFTNASTGGTWASSNGTIATVGSLTGSVRAVAVGSATITYRTSPTCYATRRVVVNTSMAPITGNANGCVGYETALSHPIAGGVWTSGSPTIATINSSTGVALGIVNGGSVITYALSPGCYKTFSLVVNNLPLPITGTATVCEMNVTILSTVTGSSGTWSSANPSVASVAPTIGSVTGVASGTTTITYTAATGCFVMRQVTVLSTPAAITGTSTICVGSQITLASATTGGTWSSNTPTAAIVGSTSGVVTAVGGGNAIISYVMPNGCRRTTIVTTNVQPAAITGPAVVCVDNTSTLSCPTLGQTWSSSNTSVATVGSLSTSTASVTPIAAGSATISYTNAFGCSRTYNITVNSAVPTITGGTSVCTGKTVTLANTTTGGKWSSSSTAKASVGSASGIVTGVASGSAVITYLLSPACFRTSTMSVNVSPAGITGLSSVIAGSSTTLYCATTGGEWSSSNTAIGVVGSASGVVTGVNAGTMTITYALTASGCSSVKSMTVNPAPVAKGVEVKDETGDVRFAMYPNPTQGFLTLESSVNGVLMMYTMDGKEVAEYHVGDAAVSIQLPADLAKGMYLCRFFGENGSVESVRLIYQQ